VVIPYRRFGATSRSRLQGLRNPRRKPAILGCAVYTGEDGIGRFCPETSVRNYHYTLRNIPEEHRSHVLRGERLNSRIFHADGKETASSLQTKTRLCCRGTYVLVIVKVNFVWINVEFLVVSAGGIRVSTAL